MKYAKYLMLGIFIVIFLIQGIPTAQSQQSIQIVLQCTDDHATTSALNQSAEILSGRLKDYGIEKFKIEIVIEKSQLRIQIFEPRNVENMTALLTAKGKLEFRDENGNSLLDSNYISSAETRKSDFPEGFAVYISFNESGSKIWAEATKKNINKSIAIVIDEVVYSAPKVMEEIKDGKCMITGDFSMEKAVKFTALVKNGELPLNFERK